jgi:hypothetical protein
VFFQLLLVPFSFLEKIEKNLQVFKAVAGSFIGIGPQLFITDRFQDLFGGFGIVPEVGGVGEFFFLSDQDELVFDVKETSSKRPALTEAP